VQVRLPVHR